jgi:prepilin-type N-terminal cleavage/methylation domain-containing protein
MKTKPDHYRTAFSLPEVLIAMVLLTLAAVSIFSMFSQARTGTIQIREEVNAISYATTILNYARALTFDDPFLSPVQGMKISELISSGDAIPQQLLKIDPQYECLLTISLHEPEESNYAFKVIKTEVYWASSGGSKRKTVLTGCLVGAPR